MAEEATRTIPVPAFHRFLHRSYFHGARWSHFFQSRVTPIAWGGLCVLLLSAVMGTDVIQSMLYQVFTLMLALVGVSMVWAWLRRAKLTACRVVPRYATVGEECGCVVRVTNEGRGSLVSFRLWERIPDPRPPLRVFSLSPEPGEKRRNAFDRVFIYYRWNWLVDRRVLFTGGTSPLLGKLKRGATETVRIPLVPQRRGVIRLQDLRVQLPDPLGFFQRCRVVKAPAQSLVVLPRRYRLPPLELPGHASFQLGGESGSNTVGSSGEFLGLREYRSGDALRHVHWKAWAKLGKPIVREFEDSYFPRYGLVLDHFVSPGDEGLFEEAVSVAASFAAAIDTQSTLLDLMFVQGEAVVVSTGRGMARAEKMLEVLAGVEPEPEEHFDILRDLVKQYAEVLTSCICVFAGWSEERARFLNALGGMGLETVNLVVCRDRAAAEKQVRKFPVGGRVVFLEEKNMQQSLMAL